jgi:hypothetical protein
VTASNPGGALAAAVLLAFFVGPWFGPGRIVRARGRPGCPEEVAGPSPPRYNDDMRVATLPVMIVGILVAGAAWAQQVEIQAPTTIPQRGPEIITPGGPDQGTHIPDAERNPDAPAVPHEPAFVGPLSVPTQSRNATGRYGAAGWTSPNPPAGPMQLWRDHPGWFSLGLAIEWGGPPPTGPGATSKPAPR